MTMCGTVSSVIIQKTFKAKPVMKQALKKQDQKADLKALEEEQMNDKELLTLAAKAVGYTLEEHYDDDQYYPWCAETEAFWNPLLDDGDTLRLMVKLKIDVALYNKCVSVNDTPLEFYGDDPYAATRRAIVRAASEIGRGME